MKSFDRFCSLLSIACFIFMATLFIEDNPSHNTLRCILDEDTMVMNCEGGQLLVKDVIVIDKEGFEKWMKSLKIEGEK